MIDTMKQRKTVTEKASYWLCRYYKTIKGVARKRAPVLSKKVCSYSLPSSIR